MSERIFVGVDGGGTRTRVVVAGADGRVVGHAVSGSTNFNGLPVEQVAANLRQGLDQAIGGGSRAGARVALGVAGVNNEADRRAFEAIVGQVEGWRFEGVEVVNDTVSALVGGLGGQEGVVLIAGTGSNCLGRRHDGRTWQAGGLEYLIDDGGSAFDLARRGLVAAVRAADRRGPATTLQGRMFQALGVRVPTEVPRWLHQQGPDGPGHPATKGQVAALAPLVIEEAAGGDRVALGILQGSVAELALMVATVVRELGFEAAAVPVCLVGGVAQSAAVRHELGRQLSARCPAARLVEPRLPPVAGALLLALLGGGVALDQAVLEALDASVPADLR